MRLRSLILGALLGLVSLAASAANPAPAAATVAPTGGGRMHLCEKDQQKCTELASKFDQWCSANAQKCTDFKAGIERHREWCENNKAECKEVREQAHADRQQWCQAHPEKPRCKATDKQEPADDNPEPPK